MNGYTMSAALLSNVGLCLVAIGLMAQNHAIATIAVAVCFVAVIFAAIGIRGTL